MAASSQEGGRQLIDVIRTVAEQIGIGSGLDLRSRTNVCCGANRGCPWPQRQRVLRVACAPWRAAFRFRDECRLMAEACPPVDDNERRVPFTLASLRFQRLL